MQRRARARHWRDAVNWLMETSMKMSAREIVRCSGGVVAIVGELS